MLSVGKIAATPTAGLYYIEQVSRGVEDYYAGDGESPGVWMGAGAAELGLAGEVCEEVDPAVAERGTPRRVTSFGSRSRQARWPASI